MQQITVGGGFVTLIHFMSEVSAIPPTEDGPQTLQWRIACMPNMTEFHATPYHPNYQRSNDVRAVTCPACKKTQAFLDAQRTLSNAEKK